MFKIGKGGKQNYGIKTINEAKLNEFDTMDLVLL